MAPVIDCVGPATWPAHRIRTYTAPDALHRRLARSLRCPLRRLWPRPASIVDKDGRTIYSNVPIKNARKIACFQPPPPRSRGDAGAGSARLTQPVHRCRQDPGRPAHPAQARRRAPTDPRRGAGARAELRWPRPGRPWPSRKRRAPGDERNYQRVLGTPQALPGNGRSCTRRTSPRSSARWPTSGSGSSIQPPARIAQRCRCRRAAAHAHR